MYSCPKCPDHQASATATAPRCVRSTHPSSLCCLRFESPHAAGKTNPRKTAQVRQILQSCRWWGSLAAE